jgi:hypothetical protein
MEALYCSLVTSEARSANKCRGLFMCLFTDAVSLELAHRLQVRKYS